MSCMGNILSRKRLSEKMIVRETFVTPQYTLTFNGTNYFCAAKS